MKRLTVYLKNQKKIDINGKKRTFNVKSFHHVRERDVMRILSLFEKKDIVKYELVNYSA